MVLDIQIKTRLEAELKQLPEDFIVAVISSPATYAMVNMVIINYLTKKRKMSGVYITMNKPYKSIVKSLERVGIDTKKLFFVDAISGIVGEKKPVAKNCVVLESPAALTELGIVISKTCQAKNPRFLMMDSLSTVLIYNNQKTTVKFVHFVATQLRKCSWPGIIFSMEKDVEGLVLDSVTQICDKIIRI